MAKLKKIFIRISQEKVEGSYDKNWIVKTYYESKTEAEEDCMEGDEIYEVVAIYKTKKNIRFEKASLDKEME